MANAEEMREMAEAEQARIQHLKDNPPRWVVPLSAKVHQTEKAVLVKLNLTVEGQLSAPPEEKRWFSLQEKGAVITESGISIPEWMILGPLRRNATGPVWIYMPIVLASGKESYTTFNI